VVIYVNETVIREVLNPLGISYKEIDRDHIKEYIIQYDEKGMFYLAKPKTPIEEEPQNLDDPEATDEPRVKSYAKLGNMLVPTYEEKQEIKAAAGNEIIKVELSLEDAWKLDKFQNCIQYARRAVRVIDGVLEKLDEETAFQNMQEGLLPEFAYFKRNERIDPEYFYSVEEMKALTDLTRQLDMCDVYLTIPGKMRGRDAANTDELWKNYIDNDNEIFTFFKEHIAATIQAEYTNNFGDSVERICLGTVLLEIPCDYVEGRHFKQPAIIEVVKHETGLCVVEILVHNCFIGGNKLLNYYRGGVLRFTYNGETFSLDELLALFSIRPYGEKRSVVFAYGDVEEQSVINTLANEEYPMGTIGGDFARRVREENIAQYNKAEVYVSGVTMIECIRNVENEIMLLLKSRLAYHVIEIFFVELLLFQDAAIDKVYEDLMAEQDLQRDQSMEDVDVEKFEQISFDMAKAVKFADYNQFMFPTTRESAKNVAKGFGIDKVFEKYEQNKDLLTQMIKANQRRVEARENKIKNRFLLILSFIATVGTICEFISSVINDNKSELIVYLISVVIVIIGFAVFKLGVKQKAKESDKKI